MGDAIQAGRRVGIAEDVLKGFKAVLKVIRAKAPKAVIIVTGIFPRNDDMAMVPVISKINERLSKRADGRKILYLDINGRLADKKGRLFEGMSIDQVHLTLKGYQVWAEMLKPILADLLGKQKQ